MLRETALSPSDLVCPIFVQEGADSRTGVGPMPGAERIPVGEAAAEAGAAADLGIPAVMLFGIPKSKDEAGSGARAADGAVQRAAAGIKGALGDRIVVMADVCLCQYTSSGHCGLADAGGRGIDNDSSVAALAEVAVSQADAGVDVVSPSAMMDGQVAAIRAALDGAGFGGVAVMSHSAKHRSSLYAPFRGAAECAPRFGDRSTYQVPYTNPREAMAEVRSDVEEGVDIVMIKPALAYLDLIAEARRSFGVPVAAYSVSGEYAMVKAAAARGWLREEDAVHEILSSIKRAGADVIVTYFAMEAAAAMAGGKRR